MSADFDWFQPTDLPVFFKALQKSPHPTVLVGGQSLTFWVDFFKIPVPKIETPYLTQDIDVLATKHDALIVAKELHGTCKIADLGDATPNTAIVTYDTPDGRKLFVDFMGMLIGLSNEEIRETAVELDHHEYGLIRILHPTLVLKSRVVNLHRLPQKRLANGVEQARLAVPVVRAFLEYYVRNGLAGTNPDKYLIDRIIWLHDLALTDAGKFVYAEWGIDVMQAAPMDSVQNQDFHTQHKPRMVAEIATKRERYRKRHTSLVTKKRP